MNVPTAAPNADPNAASNGGIPPAVPVAPQPTPAPEAPKAPQVPAVAPNNGEPKPASADEVAGLKQTVTTLQFQNEVNAKVPHLAEHTDKLVEIRNKYPSMSFEEVVGQFLGTRIISDAGAGNLPNPPSTRPISIPMGGPVKDPTQMSDAELEAAARAELAAQGLA